MDAKSISDRILELVNSAEYRPIKPKIIHATLKLTDDEYPLLRRAIKRLVRVGKLGFGANHLVHPVQVGQRGEPSAKNSEALQGVFRIARAGFGFVRPLPSFGHLVNDDVFIPESAVGSAMDGDTVEIRLMKGRGGKLEGTVREIITRSRRQFSGSFEYVNEIASVWLDGVIQEQPVQVGDIRGLPIEAGDKVIVEMVRYPDSTHPGEGVIMEVLGSSKNPAVDTIAVMHQFGLVEPFPEEVIEQARRSADTFAEGIPEGRRDLTNVPTLTIDPVDARDFDDAISLSRNEAGNWELLVHIADVSYFVPAGSALDDEAQRRATSVYLPDKVIPMLPEVISNHLASLQPDHNRLAKTVAIEMTDTGTVVHTEVFNSVIRNAKRLNYEQVDEFLANRDLWREQLTPSIFQLLSDMYPLAMMLRKRRSHGGSLELNLPEVKIDLDRTGKVKGAHLQIHTESHQIIEEFMLAANQAVATWLDDLNISFLRRVHAPPNLMKLKRLTEFVRELGIACENLENRFEIQRVIESVRGKSTEYAVNYAILKSMSKAVYQPELERHYALDMSHYCHFTSPIRRYPDLQVHRTVERLIESKSAGDPLPVLQRLGQHCSDMEQNAEFAERELIRVKLLHYCSKKIGESLKGVISVVRYEGFVVRGIEIPVDGFVPVTSLPDDRYRYEKHAHALEGFRSGNRFRLGDEVHVRIDKVDIARRQLLFQLERGTTAGRTNAPAHKKSIHRTKNPSSESNQSIHPKMKTLRPKKKSGKKRKK